MRLFKWSFRLLQVNQNIKLIITCYLMITLGNRNLSHLEDYSFQAFLLNEILKTNGFLMGY